jgi:hypothetical protein
MDFINASKEPGITDVRVTKGRAGYTLAELPHLVRFTDDSGPDQVAFITYKGPFPDLWSAEEYASKNPHNIAGLKTIHTLNRP